MCFGVFRNYTKVDLDLGFDVVENFVLKNPVVTVNVFDDNPLKTKQSPYKSYENVSMDLFGRELHFGDGVLSLRIESAKEVDVYVKDSDMIISVPRGYKGASTYYHFVKLDK